MLFYFSGTGNSLYTAKKLLQDGEQLVDMAKALRQGESEYQLNGERIGFIFPVYCFTVGDIVVDFIRQANFNTAGYTFSVVTCGANIGHTAGYLAKLLREKNIRLHYAVPLVMPDNALFYYNLDDEEKHRQILRQADTEIEKIKTQIHQKQENTIPSAFGSGFCRLMYHLMNGTKLFTVTDACIGCGKCQKNCPSQVIVMKEKRPIWNKKHCMKCTACINGCPTQAIQYGKRTLKRRRYINPAAL